MSQYDDAYDAYDADDAYMYYATPKQHLWLKL